MDRNEFKFCPLYAEKCREILQKAVTASKKYNTETIIILRKEQLDTIPEIQKKIR
jgi:hypothetical protein